MIQTYDIHQSYLVNYEQGPRFGAPPPECPPGPTKQFLGCALRSRLGIAAGLLLNSKWIAGYAQRGFDILTYKTVRSRHRPCYDPPNWVFVEAPEDPEAPVYVADTLPDSPEHISSAVCFGMPSMDPEIWRADVRAARKTLGPAQMLVVSVVATPSDGASPEEVAADFRQCAVWAAEAGADAVEANFSCPNVCSAEGTIYTDPKLSRLVAQRIRAALGRTPLLIKIGHVPDPAVLRLLLRALSGVANGVTLVNGITRPVLHTDGRPAFGPGYVRAGVLGRIIHGPSVAQVRRAAQIIREDSLDLAVAAVGGVSAVSDVDDFFKAGADAVLLGSSPMYLPDFAVKAKLERSDW